MASATVDQQPFRFLDLPNDIRFCVYEKIDFSTRHVLDRSQTLTNPGFYWPMPSKDQVYDSCITLIRPYNGFAIDIMTICRLIHQEASQSLKRKFEHCRFQPVRYLVDYSAAAAIVKYEGNLRSCLGLADGGFNRDENGAVKNFLRTCADSLSRTRPTQSGT
ncbi:hypothetical protein B5807_07716 [Epicoccum nigrum]|uniref:Uncharacterized protein n=1 Tax=Epicoccum nigrum TaxID=105696 RepID=A0A1Y2LWN9_EPING|nr:hypothetical protein B5807_07716 [Epicoccum nigrum]